MTNETTILDEINKMAHEELDRWINRRMAQREIANAYLNQEELDRNCIILSRILHPAVYMSYKKRFEEVDSFSLGFIAQLIKENETARAQLPVSDNFRNT